MGASSTRRRHRLYLRQDGMCFYCREPMTLHPGWVHSALTRVTIDHLQPLSQGGRAHVHNEVGACFSCNNARGSRDWREFLREKSGGRDDPDG